MKFQQGKFYSILEEDGSHSGYAHLVKRTITVDSPMALVPVDGLKYVILWVVIGEEVNSEIKKICVEVTNPAIIGELTAIVAAQEFGLIN